MNPICTVVLALALSGSSGGSAPLVVQPVFVATGKGAQPDGSAFLARDGFSLRVREIAGSERAELLWKLVASTRDPLAARAASGPAFRTFLLEIDNSGSTPAQLNPSFCVLRFGESRRYALGYTQAYTLLAATAGSEEEAARVAPLLEETSVAVPPGGRAIRILAFDRVSSKARSLALDLPEIRVGDKGFAASFNFAYPKTAR